MNFFKKLNKGVALWIIIAVAIVMMIIVESLNALPDEKRVKNIVNEAFEIEKQYLEPDKINNLSETDVDEYLSKLNTELQPYFANELLMKKDKLVSRSVASFKDFVLNIIPGGYTVQYNNKLLSVETYLNTGSNQIDVTFNADRTQATAELVFQYRIGNSTVGSDEIHFGYVDAVLVKENGEWKLVSLD